MSRRTRFQFSLKFSSIFLFAMITRDHLIKPKPDLSSEIVYLCNLHFFFPSFKTLNFLFFFIHSLIPFCFIFTHNFIWFLLEFNE